MTTPEFIDPRLTERRNAQTADIDIASPLEIVELMNREDETVPAAVHAVRHEIARVIEWVVAAFGSGGRLVYVGAGTSGRLGVIDAAECPPTFGSDPALVRGIIAGGAPALQRSQEGAEDDPDAARLALADIALSAQDVVIGIAASGTTPFVTAALAEAKARGAKAVLLSCSGPTEALSALCDETIVVRVGPEVLTGSTRLKAGTATKLVLNTITTGAMIRAGKAYGNLMVDLMAWSEKLRDRGERIVMESCEVDRDTARRAIEQASGSVKVAIVMVRCGVDAEEATRRLHAAGGIVRRVAGDPPPVIS